MIVLAIAFVDNRWRGVMNRILVSHDDVIK